jgi:hypothetical protein
MSGAFLLPQSDTIYVFVCVCLFLLTECLCLFVCWGAFVCLQERGIRVIPEIDTPGHVWAGFAAIPGLLTTCYDRDGDVAGTGPLDPSSENLFVFLQKLLAEVVPLFGSDMFMVSS